MGGKPKGHQLRRVSQAGKEGPEKEPEQQTGSKRWERAMSGSQDPSEFKLGKRANITMSNVTEVQIARTVTRVGWTRHLEFTFSHREGRFFGVSTHDV